MQDDAEERTLFDSKTTEKHVNQASKTLNQSNQEGQQKLREECDNKRMAASEQAEVSKAQIIKEIAEYKAESEKTLMELQQKRADEARAVVTNADLDVSKLQSQTLAIDRDIRSKTLAEAEGEAASAFQARRQQEAEMSRLNILEKLAHNEHIRIATSQENTMSLNPENQLVTQVAHQGLEAIRMKLAQVTANSVAKLETAPRAQRMKR